MLSVGSCSPFFCCFFGGWGEPPVGSIQGQVPRAKCWTVLFGLGG